MERKIVNKVQGHRTVDGAGVNLVRVLGITTKYDYDPLLMMDSFDSTNPDDYTAGFPMHPHRGIETITYLKRGKITHQDSIGHEETITDGEVQWMTAGGGILHAELLPPSERVLGVQLWLNLPAKDKFCPPKYNSIHNEDIKELDIEGGSLRLLAGEYKDKEGKLHVGFKSNYLPFNFYDIGLEEGASFEIDTKEDTSITLFTLLGRAQIGGELINEKTAVHLSNGDKIKIKSASDDCQILFMESKSLKEPIAWGGPIVMNNSLQLREAFEDLENGTFLNGGKK